jgi:hypothetical protein
VWLANESLEYGDSVKDIPFFRVLAVVQAVDFFLARDTQADRQVDGFAG